MNSSTRELRSELDDSVNFVIPHGKGYLESRYVRREQKYFTCYLSSHSGCVKSCSFCHLTATNQKDFEPASPLDFEAQAERVLEHYRLNIEEKAEFVYFSFMARGEPLSNVWLQQTGSGVLATLGRLAKRYGLKSRFCVSTIMPIDFKNREISDVFPYVHPTIYYSLYSMSDRRRHWLPAAMSPHTALTKLADWQRETGAPIKIHSAIIRGFNDDIETWTRISNHIVARGLKPSFNLVRYNPPSPEHGEEGDIERICKFLRKRNNYQVQIKERVGFDVKASCGMFV